VRAAKRRLKLHQRHQTVHLGLVGDQRRQDATEAQRLAAQLVRIQRCPNDAE
jgi:hypothetical protein